MIGKKIRELRVKKGASQQELADVVGKTQQAIYLWEKGDNEPGTEAIKLLAAYFNVTTDELLGIPPDDIKLEVNEPAQIYSVSDVDRILEDTRMALKQAIEDGNITEEKAAEAVELARRQLMLVLEQKK
jgi:transcriptional regulator with XRE-family HTH domain